MGTWRAQPVWAGHLSVLLGANGAPTGAQMYHTKLVQLFEDGAENPNSEAHAQLVDLLALKVQPCGASSPNCCVAPGGCHVLLVHLICALSCGEHVTSSCHLGQEAQWSVVITRTGGCVQQTWC